MLLHELKNFIWYNEPQGVFFLDNGVKIIANQNTAFWQNKRLSIRRDNGHFFHTHTNAQKDFTLTIKWTTAEVPQGSQSGIMLRLDSENWAKLYSSWDEKSKNKISTSLTNLGFSDLAEHEISPHDNIWYRIEKIGDFYNLSYSLDGETFTSARKFTFIHTSDEIRSGAFLSNPATQDFEATLSDLELE